MREVAYYKPLANRLPYHQHCLEMRIRGNRRIMLGINLGRRVIHRRSVSNCAIVADMKYYVLSSRHFWNDINNISLRSWATIIMARQSDANAVHHFFMIIEIINISFITLPNTVIVPLLRPWNDGSISHLYLYRIFRCHLWYLAAMIIEAAGVFGRYVTSEA